MPSRSAQYEVIKEILQARGKQSRGNLDLSKGMEKMRNSKYIGGYKSYFYYFFNQLKG